MRTKPTLIRPSSRNGASPSQAAEIVKVTPDMARKWLAKNVKNRTLRMRDVQNYARDMKHGKWKFTGEAIKFGADGTLLDGQHRLVALIEADVTLPFLVVKGLESDAQKVMDSGAKRTAADALGLDGYPSPPLLAAAARLAINYMDGKFTSAWQSSIDQVTHSEIGDFVRENPDLVEVVRLTWGWGRIPAKPAVIAFTAWATYRIDAQASVDFYEDLAEMRTSGAGDPRYTLLRRLQSAKDNLEAMSSVRQSDLFFRTWNAVRENRKLSKFASKTGTDNFQAPR